MDFELLHIQSEDRDLIATFISDSWGSPMSVSRGRVVNTTELPGFIYKADGKVVGLLSYSIEEGGIPIKHEIEFELTL